MSPLAVRSRPRRLRPVRRGVPGPAVVEVRRGRRGDRERRSPFRSRSRSRACDTDRSGRESCRGSVFRRGTTPRLRIPSRLSIVRDVSGSDGNEQRDTGWLRRDAPGPTFRPARGARCRISRRGAREEIRRSAEEQRMAVVDEDGAAVARQVGEAAVVGRRELALVARGRRGASQPSLHVPACDEDAPVGRDVVEPQLPGTSDDLSPFSGKGHGHHRRARVPHLVLRAEPDLPAVRGPREARRRAEPALGEDSPLAVGDTNGHEDSESSRSKNAIHAPSREMRMPWMSSIGLVEHLADRVLQPDLSSDRRERRRAACRRETNRRPARSRGGHAPRRASEPGPDEGPRLVEHRLKRGLRRRRARSSSRSPGASPAGGRASACR